MSLKTYIVDLKIEMKRTRGSLLSGFLSQKIDETLKKNKQVLLFLNQRGYSKALVCSFCGEAAMCSKCDIALTYHKEFSSQSTNLLCHYCGFLERVSRQCHKCNHHNLELLGSGTQKIEEDLKKIFPQARIARMDHDTTRKKNAYTDLYNKMKNHEVDIILGTQMLAKGLDLPNIQLVGLLNADIGLHLPDFRSSERTFQLITQVIGRAGRRGDESNVIIQTYNPEHPVIQYAARTDYETFYEYTLKERGEYNYPPFSQLVVFSFVHPHQETSRTQAEDFYQSLKDQVAPGECSVYFAPALILKKHNKYHYNVLLKAKDTTPILDQLEVPRNCRVDVDPIHIT